MISKSGLELTEYQVKTILAKHDQRILNFATGKGKTVTALECLKDCRNVLIICPKKVQATWAREIRFYTPIITIVTKEWFRDHYVLESDYDGIIVDEAQHFSMYTSGLYKKLEKLRGLNQTARLLLLTATPYRSTWLNVYTYYKLFGLRPNFIEWRASFSKLVKMGPTSRWLQARDSHTKEKLLKRLHVLCDIVPADTTHNIYETVEVPIKMSELDKRKLDINSYHDVYRLENRHPNKLKAVKDIIDQLNTGKIIIFAYYKLEVEWIAKELGIPFSHGTKNTIVDLEDTPMYVVQIDTAEGWEAPYHNTAIYFSYSPKYVSFIQSQGRIDRKKFLKPNYYYFLMCKYDLNRYKSVDQTMLTALQNGKDLDLVMLDAEHLCKITTK